jgi:hypothetical protein
VSGRLGSARPREVWLSTAALGGGAIVFLGVALLRMVAEGGGSDLWRLPVGLAVVALAGCGGLVFRLRFARVAAFVVLLVVAALYLLIALGDGSWWVRLASGVLAAANVYAMVLVNTQPARQYLEMS